MYYLASQAVQTKDLRRPQPPLSHGLEDSQPLSISCQGHLEQIGSPPPSELLPISVPCRPLPAWPPVTRTLHPIWEGDWAWKARALPQEAQSQGLYPAQPEGAWRNIQARTVRPLGLSGDWLCGGSQSFPGRVPELEGKGGPRTPVDLGQASLSSMERSGVEARRIRAGKEWMLGTLCIQLLGLAPAPLRSGAPSRPRLGNWRSDTPPPAITDPQGT